MVWCEGLLETKHLALKGSGKSERSRTYGVIILMIFQYWINSKLRFWFLVPSIKEMSMTASYHLSRGHTSRHYYFHLIRGLPTVDSQALTSDNEETMNSIWNRAYWRIKTKTPMSPTTGFLGGISGKEPTCTLVQRTYGMQIRSLGQEDPWRRVWRPTPLFWRIRGQKSLEGYSPQGHKELAMTEATQLTSPTDEIKISTRNFVFPALTLLFRHILQYSVP